MFTTFRTTLCFTFPILLMIVMGNTGGVPASMAMAFFIAVLINFFYLFFGNTVCTQCRVQKAQFAFSPIPKTTLYRSLLKPLPLSAKTGTGGKQARYRNECYKQNKNIQKEKKQSRAVAKCYFNAHK